MLMTAATEFDIERALDLRSPHVNKVVSELRELRKRIAEVEERPQSPALREIYEMAEDVFPI
jgi:hypothetical protein